MIKPRGDGVEKNLPYRITTASDKKDWMEIESVSGDKVRMTIHCLS